MLIRLLLLLTITAISIASMGVIQANDHLPCADEDREISGNRTSPCKVSILPEVTSIEHKIEMVYPSCHEQLIWHMPGIASIFADPGQISDPGQGVRIWDLRDANDDYWSDTDHDWGVRSIRVQDDKIIFRLKDWGLRSAVFQGSSVPESTDARLRFLFANSSDGSTYIVYTNYMPLSAHKGLEVVHACLARVQQEKADREHAADVARKEADEAVRIAAERDAAAKEEEQAQREAESQARIARDQLAAALENLTQIARTELIKTQTLTDQLVHEEELAGILRDIIRIRLSSQEDRARITNEYLDRARDASADFEVETSEIESRIQEYLDFNALLLNGISEYQSSVRDRLEGLRASIEEQQAEIDRLEAGAREIATSAEEPGENVEEDQNGNGSQ